MSAFDELIDLFYSDFDENLNMMDEQLLALEDSPTDTDIIKIIMRGAHSLKGSSGTMGFVKIKDLTHEIESIMQEIGKAHIQANKNVITILFRSLDVLRLLKDEIINKTDDINIQDSINELQNLLVQNNTQTHDKNNSMIIEQEPIEQSNDNQQKQISTPEKKALPKTVSSAQMIRVDVSRLERMLDSVEQLMLTQAKLIGLNKKMKRKYNNASEIDASMRVVENISSIIKSLQNDILRARMMPLEYILSKFPKLVRDTSNALNKEVCLIIEGGDTKVDRKIIEEINDPLIHILRNSIDHGIELPGERMKSGKNREGVVKISASQKDDHIVIIIEDDGKGIDEVSILNSAIKKGIVTEKEGNDLTKHEIINLIFSSGFSTAQKVSDISGRGVGMDIVKTNIEKINGSIEIETQNFKGTKMIIKIPSTLSIVPTLLTEVNNTILCLPISNIDQVLETSPEDIKSKDAKQVLLIKGFAVPLIRLHRIFGGIPKEHENNKIYTLILNSAEKKIAIQIDNLLGKQNVMIKPVSSYVGNIPYVSGVTLVGDGKIAMCLDIVELAAQGNII